MQTVSNTSTELKLSQKQARFFAIQIYSSMKEYIADHKVEFEDWLNKNEENSVFCKK